jgi:hypothetical protein
MKETAEKHNKKNNIKKIEVDAIYMKNRKFGFTERQLRFFVESLI